MVRWRWPAGGWEATRAEQTTITKTHSARHTDLS